MEAYANIDFLWLTSKLTSKRLQVILVPFESLSLPPAADKQANIECLCVHFCWYNAETISHY